MTRLPYLLEAGPFRLQLGVESKLMGVLNATPDSFSDGGLYLDPAQAEIQAVRMQDEGAHILDVGGESTRPGAKPVSAREEVRRVRPVLKRVIPILKIPVSIDTTKLDVAKAALDEGAVIVNDIRGLLGDKKMARMIARYGASVVLMHMKGTPRTMQRRPSYRQVVREVVLSLKKSITAAREAGIPKNRILIDPGFGFGKTADHNFSLLRHLDRIAALGYPVLVGLSRKSFLGNFLELAADRRLGVSLAASVMAAERGSHVFRVHDVGEHRKCLAVADRLMQSQ